MAAKQLIHIGAYGSQSDGGIFRNSVFGHRLTNNLLPLPQPASPLKKNLMRPYSKASLLNLKRKIYNFRHSRGRLSEIDAAEKIYCPQMFVDREVSGEIEAGEWRKNVPENGALQELRINHIRLGARNAASEALETREELADYFMTPAGAIARQAEYVLRGLQ
ncbi:hypothetical protein ANN_26030 [Periplaneta americana]|uniref:Uncharacterized protein n=1 Tax=Periplaneta americana TaxID=6978 RepID=A0ABQ8S586_PERAM|nr:hypothetical protein ANN_26030 [Periplaneta americana]